MEQLCPPVELEQLLSGLHEWRDVQGVVRSTFQALHDVAQAQSAAIREVETRISAAHDALATTVSQKAGILELKAMELAIAEIHEAIELTGQRIDAEARKTLDLHKSSEEEAQSLREGLVDLRSTVERHRTDAQQWRVGFEAGLARLASESSSATKAAGVES